MTDSPGRDGPEPFGNSYPGYSDPAYASQTPHGPTYQGPPGPAPTERLPAYSLSSYNPPATGQYGSQYPPGEPPQPPDGPKSPRWLWVVAAIAVLTVIGLIVALVIVNSSKQETVVAPLPSAPAPATTKPTPATTPAPGIPVFPLPTLPSTPANTGPTSPSTPGATESVGYNVSGDGRAINTTYVDTGGVLQTEFNVMLPWSKQVQLAQPAKDSASVSVINVGRQVSCSITVSGVHLQQRTGTGLTICTGSG
ncbi:MAG: MmpS family transport accessory protein [Mycobacterium sp.]